MKSLKRVWRGKWGDPLTQRVMEYYGQWGICNGAGLTLTTNFNKFPKRGEKGEDAIAIYFEELYPSTNRDDIPYSFEGWLVRWEIIGKIVAQ